MFEMKCLRSMTGVSRLDRVRNEVVRARTGVWRELAARVDMNVLRWFGHVERMDNERLLKKVMNTKVDGRSAIAVIFKVGAHPLMGVPGASSGGINRLRVCFLFLFLPVENFPPFCDISFMKLSLGKCLIKKKKKKKDMHGKVVCTYIR